MVAGKSVALCVAIFLGACLTAGASGSGSTDDGTLWKYWNSRGADETAFANNAIQTFAAPATTASYADVNLNFAGPSYPDAAELVKSGSPSAWYNSASFTKFYGGQVPDAAARQQFTSDVMNQVQQLFRNSGLDNVRFTSDSAAPAGHTLSLISGGSFNGDPTVLGMTYTGGNGFSYLDSFQHSSIDSLGKLETAVAKNIAHELMHAFGGDHVYQDGSWVDAAHTTWNNLVSQDPATTAFSPQAAENIRGLLNGTLSPTAGLASGEHVSCHPSGCQCPLCVLLNGRHADGQVVQPVPEPSTFAILAVPCVAVAAYRRRQRRAAA